MCMSERHCSEGKMEEVEESEETLIFLVYFYCACQGFSK